AKPVATDAPPNASDAPAKSALRRPGLSPIDSKYSPVPSGPDPPNHPKSFRVPDLTKMAPSTRRTRRLPSPTLHFFPSRSRHKRRGHPLVTASVSRVGRAMAFSYREKEARWVSTSTTSHRTS